MARVKRGVMTHKRHKKITERAEGYWGRKKNVFKRANEQVMKSGLYAYRDRRNKKRDFRRQWIVRLTAACKELGFKYGELIHGMVEKGIQLDRKTLAHMAVNDSDAFKALVDSVRQA